MELEPSGDQGRPIRIFIFFQVVAYAASAAIVLITLAFLGSKYTELEGLNYEIKGLTAQRETLKQINAQLLSDIGVAQTRPAVVPIQEDFRDAAATRQLADNANFVVFLHFR